MGFVARFVPRAFSTILSALILKGPLFRYRNLWSLYRQWDSPTIKERDYIGGTLDSALSKSAWTPTGSLIFKPFKGFSIYGTYIEGLENAGVAGTDFGGLPVTNPGPAAPIVDTEYEVGAKAMVGKTLLTLAYFDITRAYAVYLLNPSATAYTFSGRSGAPAMKAMSNWSARSWKMTSLAVPSAISMVTPGWALRYCAIRPSRKLPGLAHGRRHGCGRVRPVRKRRPF